MPLIKQNPKQKEQAMEAEMLGAQKPVQEPVSFVEEPVPELGQMSEQVQPEQPPVPSQAFIGAVQIKTAQDTLTKYKNGKINLEKRIIENEEWYKIRHWKQMSKNDGEPQPASAWLFNSLANKHADAMDNYPAPNILPNEEGDKEEAKKLSSIIPVVLEQNDFEATYSDIWWYKLKTGTGVYGVFWDSQKLNGLGDIDIKKIDILNLFWEPGITNLQKSRNLFSVELIDNDLLEEQYPLVKDKLGTSTIQVSKYIYDDTVDTTDKSAVVDWYYKINEGGRTVLHYCKFVNDTVLYASQNDPAYAQRGFYDHGLYPFVMDTLFVEEGTPCGFGYIDIMKDCQMYIDKLGQAIIKNALVNAKPRYFIRTASDINEEEFADTNNDFVHVTGQLSDENIRPITSTPLSSVYVNVMNNKIEELKETSGNRDFSQGSTASGVTAASAISALMEAGSKLSRDANKAAYRATRNVCYIVIELIRQFYDAPRCFRITGLMGQQEFATFDNKGLLPQTQGQAFGVELGYRLPTFDIKVVPQKSSPYSKMAQNELALQFYSQGFFNPQMADQALACLDMMDFDGKDGIMQKVSQNGTLMQMVQQLQMQMLQLAQIIDHDRGTNIAQGVAASVMGGAMSMPQGGMGMPSIMPESNALGSPLAPETEMQKKTGETAAGQASPR